MVPMCDVTLQYLELKAEIDAAMQSVAAAGQYILGPQVKALETELASYCETTHAIGVASGTDALHLVLRAAGIGPGDEVITTAFTFIATTEAIGMVGATPVFADIDPQTFNICPEDIEARITSRTKAIIPVHLFGQPCDMDKIMAIATRHNLLVFEDCCQALGATWKGKPVGSIGDAGCYSFFPSKNLGGLGDGGLVTTSSKELYTQVEMLRRHGGRVKYHHEVLGLNSRLDELQAAILRIKLTKLDEWNDARRRHASTYNRMLANTPSVQRPIELTESGRDFWMGLSIADENCETKSVYGQYTILVDNRDAICDELAAAKIGHAVYYPVPLHLQEVHADLGFKPGSLPHTEAAAANCLSLPMFPQLEVSQQKQAVEVLQRACDQARARAA